MSSWTSTCVLILVTFFWMPSVDCWTGNVCSRTVCGWRYQRVCVYRTWSGCCGWRWARVNYYYTQNFCCTGWRESTPGSQKCTQAICSPPCRNGGTCSQPNTCTCRDGYTGSRCGGVAACSYLKPCFPGDCQGNDPNNPVCVCSAGFTGTSCLTFDDPTFKPTINRCNSTFTYYHNFKGMNMYQYYGDATELQEPFILWSNQRDFNIIDMMMETIYDTEFVIDQDLPNIPDYIDSMKLGIVNAEIQTNHSKIGFPDLIETYPCPGPSQDEPYLNTVLVCSRSDSNAIRVDSGDRFNLMFKSTSGGFRKLLNRDTNQVESTNYYIGKTATNEIEFRFDYENPTHCIEDTVPCSDKSPLEIPDLTRDPLRPSWDGWTDTLSGVARYSFEVWKMEYSTDRLQLREPLITADDNPVPVFISELNVTDQLIFPEYTPTEPGVYSCILEVNDRANNSRYVRRFVIYDVTSEITTKTDKPLYCATASPSSNYKWQTVLNNGNNGDTLVTVNWTKHFINTVHDSGHFLSPIDAYEPRLMDGGRRIDYKKIDSIFENNSDTRNRSGIDNVQGIVKFEFAYQIPPANEANVAWTTIGSLAEVNSVSLAGVRNGDSRQFWVRATDIMGNTKTDTTIIHFDTTGPSITQPIMENNVGDGLYPFTSRVTIISKDTHSGIPLVTIKILTTSGEVKHIKQYTDLLVSKTDCESMGDCYCAQGEPDKCYRSTMTLDINNCWMGVAINETQYAGHKLEISSYNGAMLPGMKTVNIADVKELSGIQTYYGVSKLKVIDITITSFRITWQQPMSCYPRHGIKLMLMNNENGYNSSYKIFKNAVSYLVGDLNASTSYTIFLFTKYGTDESFEMSDPVIEVFTTSSIIIPEEQKGLSGGGIAGIVIGFLVLIVIFVIILIFLHRTGRLSKAKEQVSTGFSNIRQTIKTRSPDVKSGYNNRAYSSANDDDIYLYGGMKFQPEFVISRQTISIDSEISRGRFAIIYKAMRFTDNREKETVVAKTLKDQVNEEDLMKMRAKINFYATKVGHHRNILDFKGSVEDDVRGPFMVLEYCENGNMKDYLKSRKSQVTEDMQERLFRFSYGICMGMDYLASRGIVHRRLAARNILLDFLLEPKITGFGPEPTADKDKDDTAERIPIKWMAPECMTSTAKATERSDVWSYGIVLWEIFSIGETPYPDVKNQDLPNWLRQNKRNRKPEYCDDSFYKLMKKCWQFEQNKRPNFKKLKDEMSGIFSDGPDEDYYYRSPAIYDNRP